MFLQNHHLARWIGSICLLPFFCYQKGGELGKNLWQFLRQKSQSVKDLGQIQTEEKAEKCEVSATTVEAIDADIDEDLHSRQLAVYGRDTMRRLSRANVLISGLKGLGVEIAKNVILAGVRSVTLHDKGIVELWDLSSQFYLSEEDVGKNRDVACADKLKELNPSVDISIITDEITEEILSGFEAVVLTDASLETAIYYDDYCHHHNPPIAFIKADIHGVFGSVFCDFGPSFTVMDVDGEEPRSGIVASISNDNPTVVSCVDDERLEFQDGDLVVFSEVEGMVELNDGKPRKVTNARAYSFLLEEDTTKFSAYEKGGIVTQVKPLKLLNFRPLKQALSDPGEFAIGDFSKMDRAPLLHLAFQALDNFVSKHGRFPDPASAVDAGTLIDMTKKMNEAKPLLEKVDETILKQFASGSRAVLAPMAAMFGGIAGQEVVKACSGKFHPLFQFFYFDAMESLPNEPLASDDIVPLNSRYDAQVAIFGQALQQKLENAQIFVVGAGALGCEFLKNLALMGVACGEKGRLIVTDDDVIEKSNLSRQFLFRNWNVGQEKSKVAASAARAINPSLKIEAFQNRVSPETEDIFDDHFWNNLDLVINALDNVNARLYVDSRCVYFQKALLESGTLGAKCNTQMVIPYLTENYGASRDPPEKQAPMCTLHSFPHNIHHCLTWARSEFEGLFEKMPSEANSFLSKPVEFQASMRNSGDAQARETLLNVVNCLITDRVTAFEDCIVWARKRFEDYFVSRIKQLIFTFPENAKSSTGASFWSAPKRFPRPLEFSSADPGHLSFVVSASILWAQLYGIQVPSWVNDPKVFASIIDRVQIPEFLPQKGVKISTDVNDTSASTASSDDSVAIEELIKTLDENLKRLPAGFCLHPIHFEKDDDSNHHMSFIAGLANMRARNYGIPEVDKLKAKLIAGRIVPAIATTTAVATGLVCLELYKLLLNHPVEKYRNTFANLALPLFSMAEPLPPKMHRHGSLAWSVWDRWTVSGDLTVRDLLNWFEDKDLTAYSISCGQSLLYNSMFPKHKGRLDRKISELSIEIAKLEISRKRHLVDVVVGCEDDDGNDVDVPIVSILFA